ncbi:MAG: endonuclease/exonuclease/phosphatase family protein, partial [Candidatus Thorarchaeota archaeon]
MNIKKIVPIVIIAILASTILLALVLNQPVPEANKHPRITINAPPTTPLSGVVTIDVDIEDEEDLVADIYIDGTFITTANSYEWDTRLYTEGKHTIRVTAADSAELADEAFREVPVDNVEYSYDFSGIFKVLLYNVKESGFHPEWKQVVQEENADIVVFVETGYWDDNMNEDFNALVSEFNLYFEDQTPYEAYCAEDIGYSTSGEAIISRFPIVEFIQIPIVTLDDGSSYDVTHDFIDAVVDINGTEVHIIGGHLKAGTGEANDNRRDWESEGIINYMDSLGSVPIMYLSDQNSFSPEDTGNLEPIGDQGYGPMTMLLDPDDPTYGQYASSVHEFTDIFRHLNPTDIGYTFGHMESDLHARIDYIIVNSFFNNMLVNSTCGDAPTSDTGSDHYAVDMFVEWN